MRMAINVAEVTFRCDHVAYALFQFFDVRKPSILFAFPDNVIAHAYLEPASGIGDQSDFSQLLSKCG